MCGFLFSVSRQSLISSNEFELAFNSFSWRGPDNHSIVTLNNGSAILGHHRLAIIEPTNEANQPMLLGDGKTYLLFNGEIYNHLAIRRSLNLSCKTDSDTETLGAAYLKVGDKLFEMLDGMFAILIYNSETMEWVASRDAFGIKPLYAYRRDGNVIIGSEPSSIASIARAPVSPNSLREWELIRRPLPGFSFFQGVDEVKPGTTIRSNGEVKRHWTWERDEEDFSQEKFEYLLQQSIDSHELSDCENVGLLSGGLDSALIARLSEGTKTFYSVGLPQNNEFDGASDTAQAIGKSLKSVVVEPEELEETWRYLTRKRGEPLSLPNEGLIYKVCTAMKPEQKVVLTGEGADEILFGYDKIFRWANEGKDFSYFSFLSRYGYSDNLEAPRLENYFHELSEGKKPIEFIEDFFYQVHLPGLLRRMDFASMAASKEARVPFVTKSLISYLYRKPSDVKISTFESKLPIRRLANSLGLYGALSRKKIGFSAQINKDKQRAADYKKFQEIVIGELKW